MIRLPPAVDSEVYMHTLHTSESGLHDVKDSHLKIQSILLHAASSAVTLLHT